MNRLKHGLIGIVRKNKLKDLQKSLTKKQNSKLKVNTEKNIITDDIKEKDNDLDIVIVKDEEIPVVIKEKIVEEKIESFNIPLHMLVQVAKESIPESVEEKKPKRKRKYKKRKKKTTVVS